MADESDKIATEEYASLAMLADVVERKPEEVKKVLEAHGEEFTGEPEIDFLKLVALTEERSRYFTEDFEAMAEKEVKYFGSGAALTIAANLGKKSIVKLSDKLSQIREKKGKEPTKFGNWLKGIFGKKPDGTAPTPQEIADNKDAKTMSEYGQEGKAPQPEGDENGKPKPKPILGMHPALFFSLLAIVIIVIILIIIMAMRKKKKTEGGEKK